MPRAANFARTLSASRQRGRVPTWNWVIRERVSQSPVVGLGFGYGEVQARLFAMTMDTEESLKEYLKLQLHLPLISRLGPLAKTFDFVATAAPGVKEILTVGKLAFEVREHNYDLVVVQMGVGGEGDGHTETLSVEVVDSSTADWATRIFRH